MQQGKVKRYNKILINCSLNRYNSRKRTILRGMRTILRGMKSISNLINIREFLIIIKNEVFK